MSRLRLRVALTPFFIVHLWGPPGPERTYMYVHTMTEFPLT